ncbi:hypothetical protein BH23CHL4_BH23CHL4_28460 [soil metagenome]
MCGSELLQLANRLEHAYERYLPEGKGFLPPVTPIDHLPAEFERYQRACDELPDRFGAPNGSVRPWLDGLFSWHDPSINHTIDRLTPMERQKAMTMLCTLAHTYRWEKTPPEKAAFEQTQLTRPPGIDGPWTHLAVLLRQPRVGSLWNVALCNWSLVSSYEAARTRSMRSRWRIFASTTAGYIHRWPMRSVCSCSHLSRRKRGAQPWSGGALIWSGRSRQMTHTLFSAPSSPWKKRSRR